METKQLVDKFINGEITEAEFDTETSKLSSEDKVKLEEEAKGRLPDAVEKLKGARRGIDKITSKNKEEDATLASKLQKENLEEAKQLFFKDYGIDKDDEKLSFEQDFKTQNINVPNIIKDMKAHYVAKNPDKYLDLEKKQRDAERAAEEYNASNAGSNSGGGSGGEDKTKHISKDVKDFMEASRKAGRTITAEFAQKALNAARNKGRLD